MGTTNSKAVLVSAEKAEKLVTTAGQVLQLFDRHPELKETFKNIFLKAQEIIAYGVEQVHTFFATYCIELTLSLTVFLLMVDNYNRVSMAVHCLANAQEIQSRLKALYEQQIHPVLVEIDKQLKKRRRSAAVKLKKILQVRLQETRKVLGEIENDTSKVIIEIANQERNNYAFVGGTGVFAAAALLATTPPGQLMALGATFLSFLGYKFGTENAEKLNLALKSLKEGKDKAMEIEGELVTYIERLEEESHGKCCGSSCFGCRSRST